MWPNCVTNTLVSCLISHEFQIIFCSKILLIEWKSRLFLSIRTKCNFALNFILSAFVPEGSNPISFFNIKWELVPIKIESFFGGKGKCQTLQWRFYHSTALTPQSWSNASLGGSQLYSQVHFLQMLKENLQDSEVGRNGRRISLEKPTTDWLHS